MQAEAFASPWWTRARYLDRQPFLRARGAITRAVRGWFEARGFTEVETAILQISPGNETHLHAPRTELVGPDGARHTRYLRTSPEFAAMPCSTATVASALADSTAACSVRSAQLRR